MFSNTSFRQKNRFKMIASVSVTALTGLGAAMLLPHNAGNSAFAATMTQPSVNGSHPQEIQTETDRKSVV